jgi:hypothetical protein
MQICQDFFSRNDKVSIFFLSLSLQYVLDPQGTRRLLQSSNKAWAGGAGCCNPSVQVVFVTNYAQTTSNWSSRFRRCWALWCVRKEVTKMSSLLFVLGKGIGSSWPTWVSWRTARSLTADSRSLSLERKRSVLKETVTWDLFVHERPQFLAFIKIIMLLIRSQNVNQWCLTICFSLLWLLWAKAFGQRSFQSELFCKFLIIEINIYCNFAVLWYPFFRRKLGISNIFISC